jgi:hypothetical protein
MKLLLVCLFISIPVFSFAIRVSEYPLSYLVERNGFHKYANCVWWTVVTMTTIGYGDYIPKTSLGRLVTFMLSIWGVIIVSTMVVVLSTYVTPSNVQKKAFYMVSRLQQLTKLKQKVSLVLLHLTKAHLFFRKSKTLTPELKSEIKKFNQNLNEFSDMQDEFKSFNYSEPIQEIVIT